MLHLLAFHSVTPKRTFGKETIACAHSYWVRRVINVRDVLRRGLEELYLKSLLLHNNLV